MRILPFLCALFFYSTAVEGQLLHDVSVDSILHPSTGQIMQPASYVKVSARVTNRGRSTETHFPVSMIVRARSNFVVYRDTTWLTLSPGQSIDVQFASFMCQMDGPHSFCANSYLMSDNDTSNDASCSITDSRSLNDSFNIEPVTIVYPKDGD